MDERARRGLALRQTTEFGRWAPWFTKDGRSPQLDFLRGAATHRKRVFRAGNKVGKTALLAYDVIAQCLGLHPFAKTRPPLRAWISGLDRDMGIGDDLWPACRQFLARHKDNCPPAERDRCECPLDPRLVRIRDIQWHKVDKIPKVVPLARGSVLLFKSAASGRRKYQGRRIDIFAVNEEHPEDVVEEGRRGLMSTGGQFLAALTPIEGMRWVPRLEGSPNTLVVRASVFDALAAGIVTDDGVADFMGELTDAMKAVRAEGEFGSLRGAVYPNFSERAHVATPRDGQLWLGGKAIAPWPLPAEWPRFGAVDFGIGAGHSTAIGRASLDGKNGRLIFDRCWFGEGRWAFSWAELIRPEFVNLAAPVICDHDAQGRASVQAAGIPVTAAYKPVRRPGLELCQYLLQPTAVDGGPKLVFVIDPKITHPVLGRCDCYHMIREFGLYRWPKSDDRFALRPEKPLDRDNHAMDMMRYLAVWVVRAAKQMRVQQSVQKLIMRI